MRRVSFVGDATCTSRLGNDSGQSVEAKLRDYLVVEEVKPRRLFESLEAPSYSIAQQLADLSNKAERRMA
jgi:hypothetical protein